jgi:hypothetical protein
VTLKEKSMTKALILAASLGLSVSAAYACDYLRTTESQAVDKTTVVASIPQQKAAPMSVPDAPIVLPLLSQASEVQTGQPAR